MKLILYILIIICIQNSIVLSTSPLPLYVYDFYNLTVSLIDPENGNIKPYFSYTQEISILYSEVLFMNSSTIIANGVIYDTKYPYIGQYIDTDELKVDSIYFNISSGLPLINSYFNPNKNLIYVLNNTITSINPVTYQQTDDVNIEIPNIIPYALIMGTVDTILDTNNNLFYVYISITDFPEDYISTLDDYPCSIFLGCNYLFVFDLDNGEMSSSLDLTFYFLPISFMLPVSSSSIISIQNEKSGDIINIVNFNPINGDVKILYKTNFQNDIQNMFVSSDPINQFIYMLNVIGENSNVTLSTYTIKTNQLSTISINNIPGYLIKVASPY